MRDLKNLSTGDKVAGVSSILLLLLSFVKPWASYKISAFGESQSEGASALDGDAFSLLPKLAVLFALVAVVVFIMRATSGKPDNSSMLYLVLGGLAFVFLLITVIQGPKDITDAIEKELGGGIDLGELGDLAGFSIEATRGILLYIGTLLAAGIAVGGFLSKNESGTAAAPPAAPSV